MPTVLIVGSLHHDIMIEADHLPRRDETAVGTRWWPKFGGKGGNQAVAVARAGVGARMFGAVGRDGFGTFLTAALDAGGVDRRFVGQVDAPSGMSVAIMDATGDYAATIVSGANLLLDPAALADDALWHDVAILVLQNEIPEAVNVAAARQARKRGVKVVLNAAPARTLPPAPQRRVDVLIVNAVEAEMMGSAPVTDLASAMVAAETLAADYDSVIVTAGSHGLAAWTLEDERLTLSATPVNVVSTHGAGDCFTGTLAAALAQGRPLTDACRMASDAAARHVAGQA
ncbi:MAG: ribokinase [Gemmobacter sp.]